MMSTSVAWNADAFIMMYESMLTVDFDSNEVRGNVVDYTVNEDGTVFTFKLRDGMRWSDGELVTMEDVLFTWNSFINNAELTPVIDRSMRNGGDDSADVMTLEQVDDTTFTITSDRPYGGYLMNLSASTWPVYSDYIKPAHYLKPFHKDYAEECHGSLEEYYAFIAPVAAELGYDDPSEEGVWVFVFNAIDMTQWEITKPAAALTAVQYPGVVSTNFPCLNPWIMESASNVYVQWVRNPYYWKVDAFGNQLPYFDYVSSTFMENTGMTEMNIITGNIDMTYSAIRDFPLYIEEASDIVVNYPTSFTGLWGIIYFNLNYDEDPSFAEAMQYPDFRKALGYAIECDEISDVYFDRATTPSRQEYMSTYDPDKANAILDELGFLDIDGDGWRETPSGLKITWSLYPQVDGGYVEMSELITENWNAIGIKTVIQAVEASFWSTLLSGNQAPMYIASAPEAPEWRQQNWSESRIGPLWHQWWKTSSKGEAVTGIEPPDEIKELYTLIAKTMEYLPDQVAAEVIPELTNLIDENAWYLIPFETVPTGFTVNINFGNVSETDPNTQYREVYGELYFDRTIE